MILVETENHLILCRRYHYDLLCRLNKGHRRNSCEVLGYKVAENIGDLERLLSDEEVKE